MTVSERIFARLEQLSMSQREFSDRTGILPSTISEWKKKHTNPSSAKIMPICDALNVTPEWLLLGNEGIEGEEHETEFYAIKKDSDIGRLVTYYSNLSPMFKERVIGYAEAFTTINNKGDSS